MEIYFDTATFDDIERDKKIKTEAQLSLIGGTMGLLTGFSIISGVEVIIFLLRLVVNTSKILLVESKRKVNFLNVFPIFRLICSMNIFTKMWLKLDESSKAIQQRVRRIW